MLDDYFYSLFRRLPEKDSMFFMQDGTAPHNARGVREWLERKFQERLIGRRGPIEWPARSPDLTPTDFFLRGHIKENVYKDKLNNLSDFRESIVSAFRTLDSDLLKKV